jgi:hypothetical protein
LHCHYLFSHHFASVFFQKYHFGLSKMCFIPFILLRFRSLIIYPNILL